MGVSDNDDRKVIRPNENQVPILTNPIPDIKVTKNAPNSVIKLAEYFEDVEEGDYLAYSVKASSSWQVSTTGKFYTLFSLDSTQTLTLDYANDVVGTSEITVKVTDVGNKSVEDVFSVFVINSGANGDSLTGGEGNDYFDGKEGNDTLIGGNGNDILIGFEGNDIFNGGLGNDTMTGGTGNDTYVVDAKGDVVNETSTTAAEIDSVQSLTTYSLNSNVENLTLTGKNGINGTGNSLNNTITGNNANNTLLGNTGNDSLEGGAGIDQLIGGAGNDTYVIDTTKEIIQENINEGTDRVSSSVTYTLVSNLENLTLTGTNGINGTGNSLNNIITGNSANNILSGNTGNDSLEGGAGIDQLIGGAGNDTYVVDNIRDVVNETSTTVTEIDSVQTLVSYSLGTSLENLTLTGTSAINGTGNREGNSITGNTANNQIDGGYGDDRLIGNTGNDFLTGGFGNDIMTGGYGGDLLTGGSGNDTMAGGEARDAFIYDTNAAFTNSAVGIDLLADFVSGTDKIVLDKTTFTALTSVVGGGFSVASEFAVVASDRLAATAGGLIVYSSGTGNLFYNQNGVITGWGSGAQFATLRDIPTLDAHDFVLEA